MHSYSLEQKWNPEWDEKNSDKDENRTGNWRKSVANKTFPQTRYHFKFLLFF